MGRRVTMLAVAALLLAGGLGCRVCGDRPGWFASRCRDDRACRLVGHTRDACFDPTGGVPGVPVGGSVLGSGEFPGTLVPGNGVPVLPGTAPGGQPAELPYPQPSDLIPRTGVPPFAPPTPAPAGPLGVLPAPTNGTPVKATR
jgi:hypothetical protein